MNAGSAERSDPGQAASSRATAGWVRDFFPGYFALVMATGIVSLAWHFQGVESIAKPLLWFNAVAYIALWGITLYRFVWFRKEFIADATGHARGAAFLTQVAATCVLGKQVVILTPWGIVAKWLWILALVLWVVLTYTFFTAITVREPKPALENAISGAWLLIVVGTESLCTLGTLVAGLFARSEMVLFVSLIAWLSGAMFYILLITLILYRWIFRSMAANMLTPPYWINMGALAITTLAGGRLMIVAEMSPALTLLKPFLLGFTLFFWATATWWIPLLVLVGIWRHVWQRVPIHYEPAYWSLVFPLGMYSVSTYVLSQVMRLDFLAPIPRVFALAALVAWGITLIGLLRQIRFGIAGARGE